MKTKHTNNLLGRYYKAETSLEEEAFLKEEVLQSGISSPELDAFSVYKTEAEIPDGLEVGIFDTIVSKSKKKKSVVRMIFSITSAAAVLLIVLGVYLDFRERRIQDMENRFFVMEQAICHVSETLQPKESEDMLVLWVDDNVEIIIN